MTRRDVSFLAIGLAAGIAASVFAQSNSASPATAPAPTSALKSQVFTWASHPVEKTPNGERRAIFDSITATVDRLETHITTIDEGKASHAAHRHPDEELIFVREGVVEATINGVATQAPAGSVIFYASNDLHGMRNAGKGPASYFVLRWTSPGKEGPKPGGSR
jgi:XRE family transcriptional regulator, regulator of sulfur utilization